MTVTAEALWISIFASCALGGAASLALYPAFLRVRSWLRGAAPAVPAPKDDERSARERHLPRVTVLVAARNAEALLPTKIENTHGQDYAGPLECVWVSDGSTDGTVAILENDLPAGDRHVIVAEHRGKAAALERGAELASGEIIVFTDVDAVLSPDAISRLVTHFDDPTIGGVCGQRRIARAGAGNGPRTTGAQARYIAFDSWIKEEESRVGSITSNDGKLYAIRRALFRGVAEGVTDDAYVAHTVVSQGARFVFEPQAIATIPTPARSSGHEVRRRRRVVSRSLYGLHLRREVLNPARTGTFALGLFTNKVLRRAIPFFAVGTLTSSAVLAAITTGSLARLALAILALHVSLLATAALFPVVGTVLPRPLRKISSTAYYFCLGNWGTALGVLDFLRGRRVIQWDPVKSGA